MSTRVALPLLLILCVALPVGTKAEAPLPANELGRVLILMYHGIARPETEWQRTPESFRKDLETLYERGYRPISLGDLVAGEIATPAGLSPVVLTFDDGRANNLSLVDTPTGRVAAPETAVGILESFHERHPDFPLEATFFLSGSRPFGDASTASEKVRYLLQRGMDIGNHTDAHANLSTARYGSAAAIQKTIGNQAARLEQMAGGAYIVDTYALCHGARPKARGLWRWLVSGAYLGRGYRNVAVLNVGGPPAPSPFDIAFDPTSLPRIRGTDHPTVPRGLYYWLTRFDNEPGQRFVSDGDPRTVTVPGAVVDKVDEARLDGRCLEVR